MQNNEADYNLEVLEYELKMFEEFSKNYPDLDAGDVIEKCKRNIAMLEENIGKGKIVPIYTKKIKLVNEYI